MIGRTVESFFVSSNLLFESDTTRLDASYYNGAVIAALSALEDSGMKIVTVRDLTDDVFIPNRFKRNYVDRAHGVPFLQGSHIVQFKPDDVQFLSTATHANLDSLLIRKGWVLITRSGTVGRVAIVTSQWDGWAASEHIFRVVPNSQCPSGYLAAFLGSPVGQLQLSRNIFGAVVDELTEEHIRNIRVPLPSTAKQKLLASEIDDQMIAAAEARAVAVEKTDRVEAAMEWLLPKVKSEEPSEEYSTFENAVKTILTAPKPGQATSTNSPS